VGGGLFLSSMIFLSQWGVFLGGTGGSSKQIPPLSAGVAALASELGEQG